MDDADRQVLRRCRVRLVGELQVASLWDALLARELFQPDMIEDIQRAGSGSRRDQARQLVTDLETRGSRALPLFISCLEDTGQHSLASLLRTSSQTARWDPEAIRPSDLRPVAVRAEELDLRPVAVRPEELRAVRQDPSKPAPGAHGRQRGNADLAYTLNADPCGYCLIINNVNFSLKSGLSTRTGSHVDCEKLQRRFRLLHFAVEVESNLTERQMVQALEGLARRDHGALDCCVVVILSHGRQASHLQFPGAVYGTDGSTVSVEKIVNFFNGTRCPSLGGKPKLFFIQACGGEKKDHGFEVVSTAPGDRAPGGNPEPDALPIQDCPGSCDQPDAVSSLPTPSDIFVSYSTFPGFVSWRDTKSGSWYIETLDGVLEQWAHSEDLQSLMLLVADAVSEKGTYKQMPGCFNFLRKKLFFKTS